MLEWKRNRLNEVVGSWTADGGRMAEGIEVLLLILLLVIVVTVVLILSSS